MDVASTGSSASAIRSNGSSSGILLQMLLFGVATAASSSWLSGSSSVCSFGSLTLYLRVLVSGRPRALSRGLPPLEMLLPTGLAPLGEPRGDLPNVPGVLGRPGGARVAAIPPKPSSLRVTDNEGALRCWPVRLTGCASMPMPVNGASASRGGLDCSNAVECASFSSEALLLLSRLVSELLPGLKLGTFGLSEELAGDGA